MKEFKAGDISVIENECVRKGKGPDFLSEEAVSAAQRIHRMLDDYRPTPLVRLDALAGRLGIKAFFVKDESERFGLRAFKGLGGLYALTRLICRELGLDAEKTDFSELRKPEYRQAIGNMVFVTATDGNHGRGISWAAGKLGCRAHIYMPAGSSPVRAQAIRDVNPVAEVRIMETGYDDTVRYAAKMAAEKGWYLVQDTSWKGYEEIPSWIVQGYTTMVDEACRELDRQSVTPTHVFLQAGVGAMAGGAAGYLVNYYEGRRPAIGIVEPEGIACIYQSAKENDGDPHKAPDQKPTIMAGLNCGEPCTVTWPVLRDFASWYIKCPDYVSAYGMRLLAAPEGRDNKVVSGESGAVTTGLVSLIAGRQEYSSLKKLMGLDANSVVLCFSTEGDTDPDNYRRIVYGGDVAMPADKG